MKASYCGMSSAKDRCTVKAAAGVLLHMHRATTAADDSVNLLSRPLPPAAIIIVVGRQHGVMT
jgi:hypothetical protein